MFWTSRVANIDLCYFLAEAISYITFGEVHVASADCLRLARSSGRVDITWDARTDPVGLSAGLGRHAARDNSGIHHRPRCWPTHHAGSPAAGSGGFSAGYTA